MPSAFAVLRLMTSSYLVGAWHRQVLGVRATKHAIDICRRASPLIELIDAIGDESAVFSMEAKWIDRRQSILRGQVDNLFSSCAGCGATIRPPFGTRANCVIPRSISLALCTPSEMTFIPKATDEVSAARKNPA